MSKTAKKKSYMVKSLKRLLDQVNDIAPNRDKKSDGWIGDAAHAKTHSDHNPEPDGSVDAIDITHDPAGGMNSYILAERLRNSKDARISYVISNGRIFAGKKGPSPWKWRTYKGKNKHSQHVHVSVLDENQNDEHDWNITASVTDIVQETEDEVDVKRPVLRKGDHNDHVRFLQGELNKLGAKLKPDGRFGKETEKAVKTFQKLNGLDQDGVVGPETWSRLNA